MPELLHIRIGQEPAGSLLPALLHSLIQEARAGQAGTASLLARVAELLFVEVLRQHMAGLDANAIGWLAALTDPVVGRALQWLHGSAAHPWTVSALARQVGASRSLLADRFRLLVGQQPMHYLTCWRLQLAAELLRDDQSGVAAVAARCWLRIRGCFQPCRRAPRWRAVQQVNRQPLPA